MWYHEQRRRRALPDRRHVVADRDRRPHDHAAAGRHAAGAGLLHAAAAGHHGRDRRRDRARRRRTVTAASWSIKRPWPAMIRTIWGDPERYQEVVLPGGARRQALPRRRRRRCATRQTGYFTHHGPHRRRAQRVRATAWARWRSNRRWSPNPTGRRGRGRRPPRRHDRRGGRARSSC